MKIQELLPLLKPGFVASDAYGAWTWYRLKPDADTFYGQWLPARVGRGECMELCGFDIAPFDADWKDSLMECGEKKCQRCGKCCGIVPFSKDEYNAIRKYAKDKHIGFVKAELQGKTVYFPKHAYKKFLQAAEIAEKEHRLIDNQVDGIRCPFLAYDEKGLAYCTIYEHRPHICRIFGKGGHPFLTCPNNPQVNADNICR